MGCCGCFLAGDGGSKFLVDYAGVYKVVKVDAPLMGVAMGTVPGRQGDVFSIMRMGSAKKSWRS